MREAGWPGQVLQQLRGADFNAEVLPVWFSESPWGKVLLGVRRQDLGHRQVPCQVRLIGEPISPLLAGEQVAKRSCQVVAIRFDQGHLWNEVLP